MRTTTILMLSLLALAASWRLLPHPDNMTPVMAVALFAGLWLKQPLLRIAAPVGVMLVSDLLLGFHDTMVFVYVAMLVPVLAAPLLKGRRAPAYAGMAIANALVFFLVTNAGVWLVSGMYNPGLEGLLQSYVMGLPFLWKSLAGDLFFTLLFYHAFVLASQAGAERAGVAIDTARRQQH